MSPQHPPAEPGRDPYAGSPDSSGTPGIRWSRRSPGTPSAPGYHPEPTAGLVHGPWSERRYGQPDGHDRPGTEVPPPARALASPRSAPLAITSLVLGVAGLLAWPFFVPGIAAVVTGLLARRRIRDSAGRLGGDGMATSGVVLGILAVVLPGLVVVLASITPGPG